MANYAIRNSHSQNQKGISRERQKGKSGSRCCCNTVYGDSLMTDSDNLLLINATFCNGRREPFHQKPSSLTRWSGQDPSLNFNERGKKDKSREGKSPCQARKSRFFSHVVNYYPKILSFPPTPVQGSRGINTRNMRFHDNSQKSLESISSIHPTIRKAHEQTRFIAFLSCKSNHFAPRERNNNNKIIFPQKNQIKTSKSDTFFFPNSKNIRHEHTWWRSKELG